MLKKTLFLVTLLFSAVAALGDTAPAASQADSQIASYVVTLRDGSTDFAASIVHMYGGKLERRDASSFTLRISAARARRLASDPRVRSVVALSSGRAVVEASAPKELGPYIYDGAGNIQSMATEKFAYDLAGRLTDASLLPGRQQFSYDAFGNRTTAATTGNMTRCNGGADCHDAPVIASATNRISSAGYDVAGNLTSYAGHSYAYDALNMMTSESAGDLQFVYTADDERIAVYNDVQWKWAIRDAQAHVVREFTSPASAPANWTWTNDNMFRGALLLASDSPTAGRRHYHLDHLGTPRLITDDYGRTVAEYEYYPFGTDPDSNTREAQDEQSLKFTGHQRDLAHGDLHVLDYMHARYYDGAVGRFLSVDPVLDADKAAVNPQLWNRNAYVTNNPLNATDPDGRVILCFDCWNRFKTELHHFKVKAEVALVKGFLQTAYSSSFADIWFGSATGDIDRATVGQARLLHETLTLGILASLDGGPESQTVDTTLQGEAWDTGQLAGMLVEAAEGKGNFGIGTATAEQSEAMGKAWVGDEYHVASDGKTLVSNDGLRQYRPPTYKPKEQKVQANFEWRVRGEGRWQANAHLDIDQ